MLEKLEAFAAARSRPLVELGFAWLLAHPQVSSVIAGATTPEQITANARAADWHLSAAEMEELDGILQVLSHTWDTPTAHLRPFRPWYHVYPYDSAMILPRTSGMSPLRLICR